MQQRAPIMRRVGDFLMKLAQYERLVKGVSCFVLAGIIHLGAPSAEVLAQSRDQSIMQWKFDDIHRAIDEKNNQIDKHLESTDGMVRLIDDRTHQLGERVSNLQGLGEGGFGVLGVLETLGLLTPIFSKKAA